MRARYSLSGPLLLTASMLACSSETVEMWPAAPVHFLKGTGTTAVLSPATPTDKERALAEAYTRALASPGFVDLAPIVGEQAQFALGAHNTHGRARVIKGHDDVFGAFEERHFVTKRVWLTDSTRPLDSQACEWTMTGVQAHDWIGIPATQQPVVIQGLTLLWTNDDGILSGLHVYFDEGVVRAQLGSGSVELKKLPRPAPGAGMPQLFERGGTPEEAANVALARAMIQALEDGNENGFLATMTDDIEVFTTDHTEPSAGKNAARDYFRTMRGSIRHLDTVIQNAWGVGSFVMLEYAITGLQQAPLPRVPFAAGRPLHTQFVDIAEMRDGRIAHIWRYADPVAFASL